MLMEWFCAICGNIGDTEPYAVIPAMGADGSISVCRCCRDRANTADNALITEIDKVRSAGREFTYVETFMIQMMWAVGIFIRDNREPERADRRDRSDLEMLEVLTTPKHRVINGKVVPLLPPVKPQKVKPIKETVKLIQYTKPSTTAPTRNVAKPTPSPVVKPPVAKPVPPPVKPDGKLCAFCRKYRLVGGKVKTGHWVCSPCQRSHSGNVIFTRLSAPPPTNTP